MSCSTNALVHQSNTSHTWTFHRCNLEQLLVLKALQVGGRVHQSTSQTPPTCGRSMYAIQNISSFRALRVGQRVHQSTSRTPPMRGQSMYAIQNNSLFLGLYESVNECTSPLVKHLPRVDDPCMQSRTTPCF